MRDEVFEMYMLSLVGSEALASRAATRALYVKGWTVNAISQATGVPVESIRAAILNT
jgi:hypothetical protein